MYPIWANFFEDIVLTGKWPEDMLRFLNRHGFPKTAAHCSAVAEEAAQLAERFEVDVSRARLGGWLHDISVVVPNSIRLDLAQALGMHVFPEEKAFPLILHQRLSARLAREGFGVQDAAVLQAIACHTTLKPEAARLDKVVFLADKIAWDQQGMPPYLGEMRAALARSLDAAVWVYLRYLWDKRETLKVLHPWFVATYQYYEEQREGKIEN